MFESNDVAKPIISIKKIPKPKATHKIYPMHGQSNEQILAMNALNVDLILEKEKQKNKTETWNKLDKTIKMEKLYVFAEKYGKEHGYQPKDIKSLISFFNDCLAKNKLQKKKDLIYDRETYEITSIPSLHFNTSNQSFTLKILDSKRISTLKSLTPKRINSRNDDNLLELENKSKN